MGEIFEDLGLNASILLIILIVLVFVLIFRSLSLNVRLNRLERKYRAFMKGNDAQSLEKSFARRFNEVDKLFESKQEHDKAISMIQQKFDTIFSKYGIEKYDAFDDVGGKLSFALALLDKNNSGLILNAVHSRDNCFLYLKEIVKGESYVMLSQEEVEALRKAVNFNLGEVEEIEK